MSDNDAMVVLCPGQGAQAVGMGRTWCESSPAAQRVFDEAEAILGSQLGAPLRELCFDGPPDRLNRTDVSQPAIFTCSVACFQAWQALDDPLPDIAAAAGLSLGEYTALHLGGAFSFEVGLRLVATRGALMQAAAASAGGGMVALIGADEAQARRVCDEAAEGQILVPANFNAPGQIVLSGHAEACRRAATRAEAAGLRATPLRVAGAFHSPLMQPAADQMGEALAAASIGPLAFPVWSNVTGEPHVADDRELLARRLVEQIVQPVRWAECCLALPAATATGGTMAYHELAPGSVLRGLMRRTDRAKKVTNHDQHDQHDQQDQPQAQRT